MMLEPRIFMAVSALPRAMITARHAAIPRYDVGYSSMKYENTTPIPSPVVIIPMKKRKLIVLFVVIMMTTPDVKATVRMVNSMSFMRPAKQDMKIFISANDREWTMLNKVVK